MSAQPIQFVAKASLSHPLAERLRREVDGEVMFDAAALGRYSTDASIYQIMPIGVVVPRTMDAAISALQIAAEEGIGTHVRVGGLLPRQEALEFLAGASMLLSLPQDSDFAVPAKIYEYLRFEAWMLVLATPESATGRLLRDTDADLVDPEDIEGIAAVMLTRFRQFSRGEQPQAIGGDGRFDRRVQARKFLDLLTQHVGKERTRPAISGSGSRVTTRS